MDYNKITSPTLTYLINRAEDANLSFRVFDFSNKKLISENTTYKRDHFLVLVVNKGQINISIDGNTYPLSQRKVAVVFPNQLHSLFEASEDLSAQVLLFEEVLFCSDILKNELSVYNVNLSLQLNYLALSEEEMDATVQLLKLIASVYLQPTLIKKEQARFNIKILLLGWIEAAHGMLSLSTTDSDRSLFIDFKKLINTHYKEYRTVSHYSQKLKVTAKKLNTVTQKHCGQTALSAIHERLLAEIKRKMRYTDLSHKQIALDLGFSSPSALTKFVKNKLSETPTDLQQKLEQMYNT